MTPDQYSPCPCGSGKKFKWCCQPIYPGIEHALTQEANGQHDAALRILDQLIKEHPGNPEVWGQKARLLWVNGKAEEADNALQKAFELNPRYPFGLLLRAEFRFQEGEIPGALLLARRAAEAYHPDARDQLSNVFWIIFQCEDRLHRPVAARAALKVVLSSQPGNEEVRQSFDAIFGKDGALPASARREYGYLSPPPSKGPGANPARREAWNRALAGVSGR
jgi:tetratricopeptide (TPR) repeat protein